MKTVFTLVLTIFLIFNFNAQQERSSYCSCETKGTEISSENDKQAVVLEANRLNDIINIKTINNTPNAIYLFKSYFDNDISTSQFLYRYDKKSNEIRISMLPLLPYLSTKYSDKIIFQDRVIKSYQTVYDFYKIPPFSEFTLSTKARDIENTTEFVEDFDIYSLNKFQSIKKFKKKTICKKNSPKIILKVAYYNNVSTICDANAYFLNELKFNDEAKKFKVLETELK